jgi:endonuclease/exonuclease/phosphatase family metal-dependent hydrolase
MEAEQPAGSAVVPTGPAAARGDAVRGDAVRRVLARLPLVAAAGWLGFVAAHALLTGRTWLWLVFAPLPPLAFVAVPALLLVPFAAPVARRRIGLLAVVAALLLGLPQAGLNVAALAHHGPPAVPPGAVRVVAWNTEYWDEGDDPRRFTDYLVGLHADVYLLQEYLSRSRVEIDDRARLARDFPGYTILVKHELVVLSRLPVVAIPPVEPLSVLRVDVRAGGRVLSLYDVHVPIQADYRRSPLTWSFYRGVRDQDRSRRFLLRALEADVRANPLALLVAGDFNTTPAMGDLRSLAALADDAARASRQLYPRSWHAGPLHLWRLDWALTRNGVRVHSYDLHDPAGMSDHDAQDLTLTPTG